MDKFLTTSKRKRAETSSSDSDTELNHHLRLQHYQDLNDRRVWTEESASHFVSDPFTFTLSDLRILSDKYEFGGYADQLIELQSETPIRNPDICEM